MGQPRLHVRDSAGSRVVPIDHTPFTIGRGTTSDLQLGSADASRNHAEIVLEDDRFTISDSGSRYGTFVNGEKITSAALSSGDRIRIGSGDLEIVFLTGDDDLTEDTFRASAHEEIRQLATLLEGLRALGSGRVLEDVLALVLDAAIDITGAERGFIMLNSGGELEFRIARARGKVTLTSRTFVTSRKIPEEVFRTGQVRVVADLLDEGMAAYHDGGTIALGIRHVVCVPLRLVRYLDRADAPAEDQRIGVIYLDSREKGSLIATQTRVALETLAAEASVAIENARLYREALDKSKLEAEIRIAAQIQQALLPKSQFAARFIEVAATSLPCRSIGADFFDYAPGNESAFSFVVGDVAGKGPPAALLSAMMQGMCALFLQDAEEPSIAVGSMNKALHQREIESRFATLVYGLLSPEGELSYCNAGYIAPLLIGPTGVRRLETGGAVIGLLDLATYEQETVKLDPGDILVICSDGVSEAVNVEGEEFGTARIQEEIERSSGASPSELIERITASVSMFTAGAPQNDDITVMVIRYGSGAGATPQG
jgi:serine phosphatase RsbU (regulator of sigma subunit)/pSer/pThr/pTyr-binding forkhead associated (FHA) protein